MVERKNLKPVKLLKRKLFRYAKGSVLNALENTIILEHKPLGISVVAKKEEDARRKKRRNGYWEGLKGNEKHS